MHFKDVESKIHRGEMTYSKVIQLLCNKTGKRTQPSKHSLGLVSGCQWFSKMLRRTWMGLKESNDGFFSKLWQNVLNLKFFSHKTMNFLMF